MQHKQKCDHQPTAAVWTACAALVVGASRAYLACPGLGGGVCCAGVTTEVLDMRVPVKPKHLRIGERA